MPRARRSDEATLQHIARLTARISTLSVFQPGEGRTQLTVNFETGVLGASLTGPGHEPMIALITALRPLDDPGEDAYLPRVWEVIERRGIPDGFDAGLAEARADYQRYQNGPVMMHLPHPDDGHVMTGRELFELWAYGDVIHFDLDKEELFGRLRGPAQAMARHAAHDYLDMLAGQAAFLSRLVVHGYGITP
jgi:hypothetical protein